MRGQRRCARRARPSRRSGWLRSAGAAVARHEPRRDLPEAYDHGTGNDRGRGDRGERGGGGFMTTIWAIFQKERRSYFNSFVPYALAAFYVIVNGLFFAYLVSSSREASMQNMFGTMAIILIFVLPFLTMRLLAEEQASGTVELLLTAPVRD